MTTTLTQALKQAAEQLDAVHDTALLDAQVLLAHLLGHDRSYLYAWPERVLTTEELEAYQVLVRRRLDGEPVAHLTGRREFWSLPLKITADTLIPRPETELLIEEALARLPRNSPCCIADLGTGSGAIALALASERPDCHVVAVERSAAALAVAEANGAALGLNNLQYHHGSWLEPLEGKKFSLIVSNPPYITEDDPHLQRGDIRFEPRSALVSGAEGLGDIHHIIKHAGHCLEAGGWLLLEHGWQQGEEVRRLLEKAGFLHTFTAHDWEKRERVSGGQQRG